METISHGPSHHGYGFEHATFDQVTSPTLYRWKFQKIGIQRNESVRVLKTCKQRKSEKWREKRTNIHTFAPLQRILECHERTFLPFKNQE